MEDELGIPGHAGKSDWSRRLQEWLRECGFRFEAEGEATRVLLEGFMVEVAESISGEGYDVVVSIPLPTGGAQAEQESESVAEALRVAGRIAGEREIAYMLDTSLPGYPRLYATVTFDNPWSLVEAIGRGLEPLCRRV